MLYQVGALSAFLRAEGMQLNHIKAHGSLYGMAARDEEVAAAVADAADVFGVPLMGMAGTAHEQVWGERSGGFISEYYADLDYRPDGSLIITRVHAPFDPASSAAGAVRAVTEGVATAVDGTEIPVRADCVCVHSDTPNAVELAQAVHEALQPWLSRTAPTSKPRTAERRPAWPGTRSSRPSPACSTGGPTRTATPFADAGVRGGRGRPGVRGRGDEVLPPGAGGRGRHRAGVPGAERGDGGRRPGGRGHRGRRVKRLLVANRGEIAVRIIRAARDLGIGTVAVHSDADAEAPHVRLADAAVHIGPSPAAKSYLLIDALVDAARAAGADAVHPGYGFLSERAAFAAAVADAGLAFVGPSAEVIERMGDKVAAREVARAAGVPTVPGTAGRGGRRGRGGGRGGRGRLPGDAQGRGRRRRSRHPGGRRRGRAADGVPAARPGRRPPRSATGGCTWSGSCAGPGTSRCRCWATAGTSVHLFERECSLQRRRQKVVEEAGSPGITAATRAAMTAAAVRLGREVGYSGAGTVEFLVDDETGEFFFIEMNTRIQVEHPTTELVTGIDLVAEQLRVAAGEPLGFAQDAIGRARARDRVPDLRRGPGPRLPAAAGQGRAGACCRPGRGCAATAGWSRTG